MNVTRIKNKIVRNLNRDYLKLKSFQNQIEFSIELGSFVIKTASAKSEVLASLKLRHEVFFNEFRSETHSTGLDIDRYDSFFDHLVVIDKKSNKLVATYRLFSGDNQADFYSRSEFDLRDLDKLQGPFLEMGRACIHCDYRRSVVLNLLWRGIAEYLKRSESRYLMGCASIKTENVAEAAALSNYLNKNDFTLSELSFIPTEKFRMPKFWDHYRRVQESEVTEEDLQSAASLVPALLKSYFKVGAKVFIEPAWDRDFKCIDYLVLLDREKIDATYGKKYDLDKNKNEG